MRRITVTATVVGALTVGLLTGCGKGDDKVIATAPTATSDAPSTLAARSYKKADLDAALLTLADLPVGYRLDSQAGPEYSVMSSCTDEAIALDGYLTDAQAKAGTAFSTTSGEHIVQSLTLLSGAVANNSLDALKKAVDRCTTWNIGRSSYVMSKADHGFNGYETLGYRVSVKGEIPFVLDIMFLRKGNLLVAVMVGAVEGSRTRSHNDARTIFETAIRKVPEQ